MRDQSYLPTTLAMLALLMLGGCDRRPDPELAKAAGAAPTAQPGTAETRLALDVPPGLAIMIDGEPRGNTPPEPLVVAPGQHTLSVEGPCGTANASVEAAAGVLTTVRAEDFVGLKIARLAVVAKQQDGTPLKATVLLGDWAVPGINGAQAPIPACTLRLKISAEGFGGLMEDVEFAAGKAYVREVVLTPGPDVVRIHGGHFRMGPPGPDHYDPKYGGVEPVEDVKGWPWIKPYEIDVQTFDIDRTEITADQFHACYQAGYCTRQVVLAGGTRGPYKAAECTNEVYKAMRDPKAGRGNHPANCVAPWEVEKYCQWVGKRLPTDAEWEFTARSRNSNYACSWGGGFEVAATGCSRSRGGSIGTTEVCAAPNDNTEQGVCDMMDGVSELVTYAVVPGRPAAKDCPYNTVIRGAASFESHVRPFEEQGCLGMQQTPRYGFRCARDVAAAPPEG